MATLPSRRRLNNWEVVAGFSFGVAFTAIMLVIAIYVPKPTEFQIFVFRVVLAMAAAGVGGVVPGFIVLNVSPYIRAGGAIALFVIIYAFNPPAVVTGFTPFDEAIRRADTAFAAKNHSAAIDFYEKARQARPGDWKPYYGLGRVEYVRGNVTVALDQFNEAFRLEGKKDGSILYSIAMAQEILNQYEDAERSLTSAAKLLPDNSHIANDLVFDLGLINLVLWLNREAPKDTHRYRNAKTQFQSFLERRGFPPQWAHYHLACLKATHAEDMSLSAADVTALRAEANNKLEIAVRELADYASEKAPLQRQMMQRLLQTPDTWFKSRKGGEPIACPALIQSWTKAHGSINALIAALE